MFIIVINKSGIARTTTKSACPINHCQNGGTCFQTSSQTGYTCACPNSYTGHTCETGEYSTLYKNYQWINVQVGIYSNSIINLLIYCIPMKTFGGYAQNELHRYWFKW